MRIQLPGVPMHFTTSGHNNRLETNSCPHAQLSAVLPSMRAPNPNQASFVPRLLMVRLGRPEGLAPAKDRSHMHAKVAAVEQLLGPEAVAQGASTCLVSEALVWHLRWLEKRLGDSALEGRDVLCGS